jgi:hypothetical protein
VAGGVKLAAGQPSGERPKILMLKKCYLNNEAVFHEVNNTIGKKCLNTSIARMIY